MMKARQAFDLLAQAFNVDADPSNPLCYDKATRHEARSIVAHLVHTGAVLPSEQEHQPSETDLAFRKLLGGPVVPGAAHRIDRPKIGNPSVDTGC